MNEFKTVKELLSNPSRWCKGYFAYSVEGNFKDDYMREGTEDDCKCFCIMGACRRIFGLDTIEYSEALSKIKKHLELTPFDKYNLPNWNDDSRRKHIDVVKVLEEVNI